MLDGQVFGEPLEATGRVYVATENDTVYALAANTGAVVWSSHVGTPVPADAPFALRRHHTHRRHHRHARHRPGAGRDLRRRGRVQRELVHPRLGRPEHLHRQHDARTSPVDPPGQGLGGDPAAHRVEPERRQRRLRLRGQRRGLFDIPRVDRLGARGRRGAGLLRHHGHRQRGQRGGLDGRRRARGRCRREHLGGHRQRVVLQSLRRQRLGDRAVPRPEPGAAVRPEHMVLGQRG